jgi:TonB family protein
MRWLAIVAGALATVSLAQTPEQPAEPAKAPQPTSAPPQMIYTLTTTPPPVERAYISGAPGPMTDFSDLDDDCISRGEYVVRVVESPAHGAVSTKSLTTIGNYGPRDIRHACNGRSVTVTRVFYEPEKGFSGEDSAVIEAKGPRYTERYTVHMAVWPDPIKTLRTPAPKYPRKMLQSGITAVVTVMAYVDWQGNVSRVAIKSSPGPEFSQSVEATVAKWKFESPLTRPTPALIVSEFEIKFDLKE